MVLDAQDTFVRFDRGMYLLIRANTVFIGVLATIFATAQKDSGIALYMAATLGNGDPVDIEAGLPVFVNIFATNLLVCFLAWGLAWALCETAVARTRVRLALRALVIWTGIASFTTAILAAQFVLTHSWIWEAIAEL